MAGSPSAAILPIPMAPNGTFYPGINTSIDPSGSPRAELPYPAGSRSIARHSPVQPLPVLHLCREEAMCPWPLSARPLLSRGSPRFPPGWPAVVLLDSGGARRRRCRAQVEWERGSPRWTPILRDTIRGHQQMEAERYIRGSRSGQKGENRMPRFCNVMANKGPANWRRLLLYGTERRL